MSKVKIINNKEIDSLGTVKQIVYDGDYIKKTYLSNEKNRSNYKTIIKEIKENDVFILKSRLEIGEKYNTYFLYDENKIVLERRFNKIKKTSNYKELFISNEKGDIFINTYKKEKTLSFNLKKLKNVRNKK